MIFRRSVLGKHRDRQHDRDQSRKLERCQDAECAKRGVRVHYPELHLCTDNGAMIAMAAAMRLQSGVQEAGTTYAFDVKPRWPLQSL
jgi:N6-L-threonylcarbamoyladenine synthase